jgi:cytochrome c-type biogenesis protein CcmH/NrfF
MLDSLPDSHPRGVRALREGLERSLVTCSNCGFEDPVLHSEWRARLETDPRTGQIRYRLRCPDCAGEEVVQLNF